MGASITGCLFPLEGCRNSRAVGDQGVAACDAGPRAFSTSSGSATKVWADAFRWARFREGRDLHLPSGPGLASGGTGRAFDAFYLYG